ncbi:MAG TPA: hypothetical protein VLV78_19855 [Thermoanaerobaculia bacterium]|nr:hypothetical protein [Thermoanaerobaculia bacterium]
MNLYLVLAIALGAISGVVEAPVMRPVEVVRRDVRAEQRVRKMRRAVVGRRSSVVGPLSPTTYDRRPTTILNAAPRAPAFA